jgi:hypothetical protein
VVSLYEVGNLKSDIDVASIGTIGVPCTNPVFVTFANVVENKDRFLEGRFFFDDWDRSLAARGLVKQQRLQYRELPDYRERLGAFEWLLPTETHSDNFVAQRACWWIDTAPKAEPLFLQIGFPGPHPPYDPTPEYLNKYIGKKLPIAKVTDCL